MELERSRLLVIEDDTGLRELIARQLADQGYRVQTAADGVEGLDATREYRPQLVLCDWAMPRLDGLEYCRSIKADPELKTTWVAMLSGRADDSERVSGLDAGADDFLVKPMRTPELLARVRAGLRITRLQQELIRARHEQAITAMAVTLGHEINNPLTALLGHLELSLDCIARSDDTRTVHHIRGAADSARRIAEVARRLSEVRTPRTKPYLGQQEMVDLGD